MFSIDTCPRPQCGKSLPNSFNDLANAIPINEVYDVTDEWHCPWCSYPLYNYWFINETCWYDGFSENFNSDGELTKWLCCNTRSMNRCGCEFPLSFVDAVDGMNELFISPGDIYDLTDDWGEDCSTCTKYMTDECWPLTNALYMINVDGTPPAQPLTWCHQYIFNEQLTPVNINRKKKNTKREKKERRARRVAARTQHFEV